MVTRKVQIERRTAKERWPETDVLPLSHVNCDFAFSMLAVWNNNVIPVVKIRTAFLTQNSFGFYLLYVALMCFSLYRSTVDVSDVY